MASQGAHERAQEPSEWRARLALVALAFAVFAPALSSDYVLDGAIVVRDNPLLEPFEPLRIAGLDWWEGTGRPGGLYRPVPLVLLAALREFGAGAIGFANVASLGIVAVLRYELLRRLLGGVRAAAWIAAALALVHPTHAELAGGQVGLADNLASAFVAASALTLSGQQRAGRLAFGALFAALAVLSKESGVLVVPLVALLEALREPQRERRPRIARAGLSTALGVGVALLIRFAAIGTLASADDPVHAGFPLGARLASAMAAFSSWTLASLVAPWEQLAVVGFQDVPPAETFADLRSLAGLVAVLALAAGALFAWRRGARAIAFGLGFFLVAWLPTSNLLVPTGAIAASRFLDPGLFALCLPLALAIVRAWERGAAARAAAFVLAVLVGPVLAVVAWNETAAWKDSRTLLESQAARAPHSAYELVDLARAVESEAPARAAELYERALATSPVRVPGTDVPPEDLLESFFLAALGAGRLAERSNDAAKALANYRAAVELCLRAQQASNSLPFREDWARSQLAVLERSAALELREMRETSGAEREATLERIGAELDAAEAIGRRSSELVRLRALWFDRKGDAAGRRRVVEAAWNADPSDPLVRILWAGELRQAGRSSEALGLELAVLEQTFDSYERSRALAIAREAATNSDVAFATRGRRLLQRLAQPSARRAPDEVAAEATRLLRSLE